MIDGAMIPGSVRIARHATMTAAMKVQNTWIQYLLVLLVAGFAVVPQLQAQALHRGRLANGCELLVVAQPLADATTVVWPSPEAENLFDAVTSGNLTLVADLEEALSGGLGEPTPAVVVAVGGAAVPDLTAVLDRLFDQRPVSSAETARPVGVVEGRMERRLGAAGSDPTIRLEIAMPAPDDLTRSAAEVLWDLIPDVLAGNGNVEGLRTRVSGDLGLLEARTEAGMAEIAVGDLRLGLAKLAESPKIRSDEVSASVRRLVVRRAAVLESHPEAALRLLDLWLTGGDAAVREFLFAAEGVTVEAVRNAATQWLPRHPGNIVLTLPPTTFNPRFASPPQVVQLNNGLTAAILERRGASLATMCMRPVVIPDLDSEMAAAVLSRVARELRESDNRPGWVRVSAEPPQLELALPADGFVELGEALQSALATVARDTSSVLPQGGDARRRAIRLMAGLLGVAEGTTLSPATLLESSNIALGIVAEDGEVAAEALQKFWAFDVPGPPEATVRRVPAVPKTREAAAGRSSVLVVAVDLATAHDEAVVSVFERALFERAAILWPEAMVEVRSPFVPGHRVVLLVVEVEASLEALEDQFDEGWTDLTRPATEEELGRIRRQVAAAAAARWSGATGRARRGAAVAAGAAAWRTASDLEMTILSVESDVVNIIFQYLGDWRELDNTGAGLLPIIELDSP